MLRLRPERAPTSTTFAARERRETPLGSVDLASPFTCAPVSADDVQLVADTVGSRSFHNPSSGEERPPSLLQPSRHECTPLRWLILAQRLSQLQLSCGPAPRCAEGASGCAIRHQLWFMIPSDRTQDAAATDRIVAARRSVGRGHAYALRSPYATPSVVSANKEYDNWHTCGSMEGS